jgi:hypothetical protein
MGLLVDPPPTGTHMLLLSDRLMPRCPSGTLRVAPSTLVLATVTGLISLSHMCSIEELDWTLSVDQLGCCCRAVNKTTLVVHFPVVSFTTRLCVLSIRSCLSHSSLHLTRLIVHPVCAPLVLGRYPKCSPPSPVHCFLTTLSSW